MVIEIGNCLVSTEILTEYFCCDYDRCKGICCVVGDSGAPLEKGEKEQLTEQAKDYEEFLAADGKEAIEKQGRFVIDIDGDEVTPLVPSDSRCAYSVTDEQGYTYCAVERGYCKNNRGMRKPLSCWIFPIRIKKLSTGVEALTLSREHLCKEAFAKGKEEGIKAYEFLKEPIIKRYGVDFYGELTEAEKLLNEQQ